MVSHLQRQGAGRYVVWLLVALGAVIAGISAYFLWYRDRPEVDAALQAELASAPLTGPAPTEGSPGDWPQWRGPNRDGVSREVGVRFDWPREGPPRLWSTPIGAGFSSIAIVGDRLYTMSREGGDEVVLCLDAATGKEHWRRPYPCTYSNEQGSGPRSTPSVDGGRVYSVGATGVLNCLDAASGEVLWRHDLQPEFLGKNPPWGVSFSPLVRGDLVYTQPGGPDGRALAAFHKKTGALVWQSLDDRAAYSSPIAMDRAPLPAMVCYFTAEGLVGVSASDGRELWRFPWKTSNNVHAATPVHVGDYLFLSSGYGSGCALVKLDHNDSHFEARRVYKNHRVGDNHASNVYYQEHLYGFHDGRLICLEFRTGEMKWSEPGFGHGSLLAVDGHLIVLAEDGKLMVVEARPDRHEQKSLVQLAGSRYWTMPVLAHGRLYVRDERQIECFDLERR